MSSRHSVQRFDINVNFLDVPSSEITDAFFLMCQKTYFDLCSDVYVPVSFKRGMIIVTSELHFLIAW